MPADPQTTERRRQETEALLQRFIGRTNTPGLQAEVVALLVPLQRSWDMEDTGDVVTN